MILLRIYKKFFFLLKMEIVLFNQNINCYNSNNISDIVLSHQDNKYKISINELFEYLQSRSTISKDLNKKDIIHSILVQKSDDIVDEFSTMKDEELIYMANILLKDAKKSKINEFYKEKNIPYRPFNLIGLVSNNKIECESKRKTIRELCRKCYDFLYPNSKNLISEFKSEKDPKIEDNPFIHSKTCIYKFKRGDKKGVMCGNVSIENENYCKICIGLKSKVANTHLIPIISQK